MQFCYVVSLHLISAFSYIRLSAVASSMYSAAEGKKKANCMHKASCRDFIASKHCSCRSSTLHLLKHIYLHDLDFYASQAHFHLKIAAQHHVYHTFKLFYGVVLCT